MLMYSGRTWHLLASIDLLQGEFTQWEEHYHLYFMKVNTVLQVKYDMHMHQHTRME